MIFLFGDYGVYNQNPSIYGLKRVFDKANEPCQVVTPTMDLKHQQVRAAEVSGFSKSSVWSIYDCFTGRMFQETRAYRLEDYAPPEGYTPLSGPGSRQYRNDEGNRIEVVPRIDGSIEQVKYFDGTQESKRELYDDGGYLSVVEYILGEDAHSKILTPRGETIFELYQTGKYRQVAKVRFVPENRDFLSEQDFFRWAFEWLVAAKAADDKFFILSETFRRALETAEFNKKNVYLLVPTALDENIMKDILFDHYEKIIFNTRDSLNKLSARLDEKTESKLYWNNYIASDRIPSDFSPDHYPVYLNLGTESDLIRFDEVVHFVKSVLDADKKIHFIIEFSLLRNQVDFLQKLAEAGVRDSIIKYRVIALTRPWPGKIREEMAKAILYIHYQNPEMVSLTLATALSVEKPILGLTGDPLLEDYTDSSNSKRISLEAADRMIQQAVYDISYVLQLAPNPSLMRKKYTTEVTMARWQAIFEDTESKI